MFFVSVGTCRFPETRHRPGHHPQVPAWGLWVVSCATHPNSTATIATQLRQLINIWNIPDHLTSNISSDPDSELLPVKKTMLHTAPLRTRSSQEHARRTESALACPPRRTAAVLDVWTWDILIRVLSLLNHFQAWMVSEPRTVSDHRD